MAASPLRDRELELCERHQDLRLQLEEVLGKLHKCEAGVVEQLSAQRSERDEWEQRCAAAERARAEETAAASALQAVWEDEAAELALLRREEQRLLGEEADAAAEVQRLERSAADDALLAGARGDKEGWVRDVAQREVVLRGLEDEALLIDAEIEGQVATLEQLRREQPVVRHADACAQQEAQLREGEGELAAKEGTLAKLKERLDAQQERRDVLRLRVRQVRQVVDDLERREEELRAERERERGQLAQLQGEYQGELDQATGMVGSPRSDGRLADMMMLLKASIINLQDDALFVKEVNREWGSPGAPPLADPAQHPSVDGFSTAVQYIRRHIIQVHGSQLENTRWRLQPGWERPDASDDDVQGLLSAVKQAVVCYDQMPAASRAGAPHALEIVRNGAALRCMAEGWQQRFDELREAEERRAEEEAARSRRRSAGVPPRGTPRPLAL